MVSGEVCAQCKKAESAVEELQACLNQIVGGYDREIKRFVHTCSIFRFDEHNQFDASYHGPLLQSTAPTSCGLGCTTLYDYSIYALLLAR